MSLYFMKIQLKTMKKKTSNVTITNIIM